MSRGALIVSLVLHAGLLTMVARWPSATTPETGARPPGVAVSFLSDEADAAPAVPAFALPDPVFTPPPASAEPLATAPSALPAEPSPLLVERNSALVVPVLKPETAPAKSSAGLRAAGAARGKASNPRGAAGNAGPQSGGALGRELAGYVPPQYRLRYPPPYPAEARTQRWEGTVLLLVSVDAAGHVARAVVRRSSGHPALDRSALDSVRFWRFEPARQNGLTTAAEVEVPVRFCLS